MKTSRIAAAVLALLLLGQAPPVDLDLPYAEDGAVTVEQTWGEPARELQRALLRLGYVPGPVDGVVGSRTVAALREFQRCNGLRDTGRIGRSARSLLHLGSAELYDPDAPGDLYHRQAGVNPPSVAGSEDIAGSDPLDATSMPDVFDAAEPLDGTGGYGPRTERDYWTVAVTRDQCTDQPADSRESEAVERR